MINIPSNKRILTGLLTVTGSVVNTMAADGPWSNRVAGCANSNPIGLRRMLYNVYSSYENVAELIGAMSYIGGLTFIASGIMKFKQYRDNPTQVSIGTPITFIIVGVLLIFLPTLIRESRETIFTGADLSIGVASSTIIDNNMFAVDPSLCN